MTELETWNCMADKKNWNISSNSGRYWCSVHGRRLGQGLCTVLGTLFVQGQISVNVHDSMKLKIKQYKDAPGYIWSLSSARGNIARRKFCRGQAKLLKDA